MPLGSTGHRIVVVEDDDSLREMMCELLQLDGYLVVGCRNGPEGLRSIRELKPSVVTLDLHMPGMDGVEVLDRLQEDETTSIVPVIIVSAYASDRRARWTPQVKGVIQKPFDLDELCRQVHRAATLRFEDARIGRRADAGTGRRGEMESLPGYSV